jgi:hypothetical protein
MKTKLVYIAARFSAPNEWEVENNVRIAENMAFKINAAGHFYRTTDGPVAAAVCVHTMNRYWHNTLSIEFWYHMTQEILRRCDAVVFVGPWVNSVGCQQERALAMSLNLQIFDLNQNDNLPVDFLLWMMN